MGKVENISGYYCVYMVSKMMWLMSFFIFYLNHGFIVFLCLYCQHHCFSFSHHTYHYSWSDHYQIDSWQLSIVESIDCFLFQGATSLWLSWWNHTCSTSGQHCCSWRWHSNSSIPKISTLAFARSNDTQCYYLFSL